MGHGGAVADEQPLADLPVGHALDEQAQDLDLALGEARLGGGVGEGRRWRRGGRELGGDVGGLVGDLLEVLRPAGGLGGGEGVGAEG